MEVIFVKHKAPPSLYLQLLALVGDKQRKDK